MSTKLGVTEDVEDILQDSLEFLGGDPVSIEDGTVRYGPLALTVSPKEGKANTLLADHLFSPALVIAERFERGLVPLSGSTILELGAGAALPALLASTLPISCSPRLVAVTDYPDPTIVGNLAKNVSTNSELVTSGCRVVWHGHEWGINPHELLSLDEQAAKGYSILILSDLLHFDGSHQELLVSLTTLLARTPHARAYVGAGKYTPTRVCDSWLALSRNADLEWSEVELSQEEAIWRGGLVVMWSGKKMSTEELGERKRMCRLWIGRWSEKALKAAEE